MLIFLMKINSAMVVPVYIISENALAAILDGFIYSLDRFGLPLGGFQASRN